MLSKSSGQNSCDYGSIDFLMKESNQFFIKNFNGFDPQICDEGHERTDKCKILNTEKNDKIKNKYHH